VDIPKKQGEILTAEDLEKATPKIKKGDIVIIHTGWNKYSGDNEKYFLESPGLGREAGEWFVEKGVKCVGVDQQALDHPLHTAIGPPGPLRPDTPSAANRSKRAIERRHQLGHRVLG